jgi:hypothetical protein
MITRCALWLSLAVVPGVEQHDVTPATIQPTAECVDVATPAKLAAGKSFIKPIGHELEFRLTWDRAHAWDISVGPSGSPDDYLWVVSPPIHNAPHLVIGAGYGLTAVESAALSPRRESAALSPRRFHFVTTARDLQDARQLIDRAERDAGAGITVADIERKGKGSLELQIVGFEPGPSTDTLAWISVRAHACQAR